VHIACVHIDIRVKRDSVFEAIDAQATESAAEKAEHDRVLAEQKAAKDEAIKKAREGKGCAVM
jgi:ribosomal protein L7/L12